MARYIFIDNATGCIFGDTADMPGFNSDEVDTSDYTEACRVLDEQFLGVYGLTYELADSITSDESGYCIYRVDVNGGDAVADIHDGQDREAIEAVDRNCLHVATVRTAVGRQAARSACNDAR